MSLAMPFVDRTKWRTTGRAWGAAPCTLLPGVTSTRPVTASSYFTVRDRTDTDQGRRAGGRARHGLRSVRQAQEGIRVDLRRNEVLHRRVAEARLQAVGGGPGEHSRRGSGDPREQSPLVLGLL